MARPIARAYREVFATLRYRSSPDRTLGAELAVHNWAGLAPDGDSTAAAKVA